MVVQQVSIRSSLLFAFLLLSTLAQGQRAENCNINILRVPNPNNQLYALLCRCGTPENPRFRGRVTRRLPPGTPDTAARASNTVHCLRRQLHHLRRRCEHSKSAFVHSARHALHRCVVRSKPRFDDGKPFTFNKSTCGAEFRTVAARGLQDGRLRLETFIVCTCPQGPNYNVHTGSVNLLSTSGASAASNREAEAVMMCTRDKIRALGTSCNADPSDRFELRAAQALNVCCKRRRVRQPQAKLQCQSVVPNDVSTIQIQL